MIANHIGRIQPFRTLLALEIDSVAFIECLEPALLNRRKMHKYIFAGRALNESVTLGPAKPLHNTTFAHKYFLSFVSWAGTEG